MVGIQWDTDFLHERVLLMPSSDVLCICDDCCSFRPVAAISFQHATLYKECSYPLLLTQRFGEFRFRRALVVFTTM